MAAKKFSFVACPFCGAQDVFSVSDNADLMSKTYWVTCGDDTCQADGPFRKSSEAAVEAWNARSPAASVSG